MVSRQHVTIGDQISIIRNQLIEKNEVPFNELIGASNTRVEVIVTLLAVLELMKRRMIDVSQAESFGDITLKKLNDASLSDDAWAEMTDLTDVS